MAQLQPQPVTTGKKNRSLRASLKIDMTPMVDLGFLLLTFFIFTTTMGEPHTTKLYMPADGTPGDLCKSCALTLILKGNDSVYYYHGKWEEAVKNKDIHLTNYDVKKGLGAVIRQKQKNLQEQKESLMLLIKPLEASSYKNLMNALDEVLINDVKKYAILDAEPAEAKFTESMNEVVW